jgi:hypothetical protein
LQKLSMSSEVQCAAESSSRCAAAQAVQPVWPPLARTLPHSLVSAATQGEAEWLQNCVMALSVHFAAASCWIWVIVQLWQDAIETARAAPQSASSTDEQLALPGGEGGGGGDGGGRGGGGGDGGDGGAGPLPHVQTLAFAHGGGLLQSSWFTQPGAKPGANPRHVDAHGWEHRAPCPADEHEGAAGTPRGARAAPRSRAPRISISSTPASSPGKVLGKS